MTVFFRVRAKFKSDYSLQWFTSCERRYSGLTNKQTIKHMNYFVGNDYEKNCQIRY